MDILIDLAYGDCCKGRMADYLIHNYTAVGRFAGGGNCGAQIKVKDTKITLHHLPSGVLHPNVRLYLGGDMVIDPIALVQEIENLESMGISVYDRLFIAHNAHIVTQNHKDRDIAFESGNSPIGTTKKGIGPCYADKAARIGIRMESYKDARHHKLISRIFNDIPQRVNQEAKFLTIGNQGTFLSVSHGTYPFTTSCDTLSSSACVSFGVSPKKVDKIIGVTKAYTTRVGNGPFATELNDKYGKHLQTVGNEFGSTTGRPRRCGWLNLDELNHAIMLNGVTELVVTKLDVLSGLDIFKFYIEEANVELEGWSEDISNVRKFEDLPSQAKHYLGAIQHFVNKTHGNIPIKYVSVGPEREQLIIID